MTTDDRSAARGGAAGHLDELTLLLLAEGEPVEGDSAAHAAACSVCSARVAAFRAEALVLGDSFALAPDELAFLHAAALPEQIASRVEADAVAQGSLVSLLWWILPFLLGYLGWLFALPYFADALDLVRDAGGLTLALTFLTDAAISATDLFASLIEGVSAVPGFGAPVLALSFLAAVTWVALLAAPRREMTTA
jgi:hypothetical protein